jgi:hypothetical protein
MTAPVNPTLDDYLDLPEWFRDQVQNAAARNAGVPSVIDLDPHVRRQVRERAVTDYYARDGVGWGTE